MPALDFSDQAVSDEQLDFSSQAQPAPDFSKQAIAEPAPAEQVDFSPESDYTPPNLQSLKEFFAAKPNFPKPQSGPNASTTEKIVTGAARAGINVAESILTPTTAALVGVGAIPVVGKPLAIAAGAGMGAHAAITGSQEFYEAVKRGDVQGAAESAGNAVAGLLFAGIGMKATAPEVPTAIEGTVPVETKVLAPASTEAFTKGEPNASKIESPVEVPSGQTPGTVGEVATREASQLQEPARAPETTPISQPEGQITVPEGPGAAGVGTPGTVTSQIAQLTDVVKGMESSGIPWRQQLKQSVDQSIAQAQDLGGEALARSKGVYAFLKNKLLGPPGFTEWKRGVGRWDAEDQLSGRDAYLFAKETQRAIPQPERQAAISKWVDSGGDMAILQAGEAATRPEFKQAYRDAQNLTPEELNLAQNIQNYFDAKLQDAIDNGMIENGLDNYIHRIYPKENQARSNASATINAGVLQPNPSLIRKRLFQFDYEAEAAGKSPVQGFADRILAYDQSFNRALSARTFIKWLQSEHKEADGRPSIDIAGMGKVMEDPAGNREGVLINPHYKTKGLKPGATPAEIAMNNRADYVAYDHPALRNWKWVAEDANGKPILVKGDLLVHPDRIGKLDALLGKSWFQLHEVPKTVLKVSSTVKQTMLDMSLFHPVQIKFHSLEHRVTSLRDIDPSDPVQKALIEHALVIFDHRGHQMFSEGLAGGSLSRQIPIFGPKIAQAHDFMFKEWIPKIKMTMAVDALARNQKRYGSKLSQDDILYLTANESNAAFGFQNYRDLGMHPSYQDALRAFGLAPDFLISRARFVGQALNLKYGREQAEALALGALALYTTARLGNYMASGEWRWDKPFEVVMGGKAYGIRSVQEDLYNAVTQTRKFIYGRVNPLTSRTIIEALTGRDYRGRSRTALEQVKDLAKVPLPIPFKTEDDKKLTEAFVSAMGFTIKRDTAAMEIFRKAEDWKKDQGIQEPGEFIYDPEKDPYRKLKIALSIMDESDAKKAVEELKKDPAIANKLTRHMVSFYNRPFTGSAARETAFKASLSDDERKLYEDARKEKTASLALFRKVLASP